MNALSKEIDHIFDMVERSAIGFNRVVPRVVENAKINFPPFNVIKVEHGKYRIEVALAGFTKDDIDIHQNNNFIVIEGESQSSNEEVEFLYKGIAARHFRREIPVANGVKVISASLTNGILSISLENEEATLRQIEVT